MKFIADRDALLRPLQLIGGVIERRSTLPVLANVLVEATAGGVRLSGTDLEVSLTVMISTVAVEREGVVTIPARKLTDICKSLPDGVSVTVEAEDAKVLLRSGRSRYTLATLPFGDFPALEQDQATETSIEVSRTLLEGLVDQVSFSMAQQDVRYFLNGMYLEVSPGQVRVVATDGHRLAMASAAAPIDCPAKVSAILPRKAVQELGRLLAEDVETVTVALEKSQAKVTCGPFRLGTKLIDGRFPDYEKVIPKGLVSTILANREGLRSACARAAILSNEKYRGVRVQITGDELVLKANNPEQEEAEEVIPVSFNGEPLDIGFNVTYLQDVLGALGTEEVRISLTDANSSAVIEGVGNDQALYVVMPMRL